MYLSEKLLKILFAKKYKFFSHDPTSGYIERLTVRPEGPSLPCLRSEAICVTN